MWEASPTPISREIDNLFDPGEVLPKDLFNRAKPFQTLLGGSGFRKNSDLFRSCRNSCDLSYGLETASNHHAETAMISSKLVTPAINLAAASSRKPGIFFSRASREMSPSLPPSTIRRARSSS